MKTKERKKDAYAVFATITVLLWKLISLYFQLCTCCRYQIMVLELLARATCERQTTNWSNNLEIQVPSGLDLSQNTEYASQAAIWGIEVSTF